MKNSDGSKEFQTNNKISVCDVMKKNSSKIIERLESDIPLNLQQYSDLYSAYFHTLDDVFGTCYIAEKEFFDKLNIDQGILTEYQKYSDAFTEACLNQIGIYSKIKEGNVKLQITHLKIYDDFIHSLMDSYGKFLSQFNNMTNS